MVEIFVDYEFSDVIIFIVCVFVFGGNIGLGLGEFWENDFVELLLRYVF